MLLDLSASQCSAGAHAPCVHQATMQGQDESGLALLIADRCDGLEDDLRCSLVDRPAGY